ncbi:hypothetical protein GCM10027073_01440 [Streptomyces chlorus]|uniref:DUF6912 family protein n=1 Tax=Streptomyces chlorus TaxID=887452 RepID=A0ABW1DVC5_9ACTN
MRVKAADKRVYVPLTLSGLAEAYRTGELGAGLFPAYGVTPALREWYLPEDVEEAEHAEELEYAALGRAALASLRLLAADAGAPRRRVVVAVDVPDRAVSADPAGLGELRVDGPVRLDRAAAVHVDAADAEPDVTSAAQALPAADSGDNGAQSVVDRAEDHELLWYATQEIPNLLEPTV